MKPSLIATLVLFAACTAQGKAGESTLEELFDEAEYVAVVTVTQIKSITIGEKPYKLATAKVDRIFKGDAAETLQYIASPSWTCDVSHAEIGEKSILFLDHRGRASTTRLSIMNSGAGRLIYDEYERETHIFISHRVITKGLGLYEKEWNPLTRSLTPSSILDLLAKWHQELPRERKQSTSLKPDGCVTPAKSREVH